MLNVVDLTTVKIVAPVKRLQTKTQVNARKLIWLSAGLPVHLSFHIGSYHRPWVDV